MKFYTNLREDTENKEWWVECARVNKSGYFRETGIVADGKTPATTLRKAARALEREAARCRKEADKYELVEKPDKTKVWELKK